MSQAPSGDYTSGVEALRGAAEQLRVAGVHLNALEVERQRLQALVDGGTPPDPPDPPPGSTEPVRSAADSRARVVVVPTATTRPPCDLVARIASAADAETTYGSGSTRCSSTVSERTGLNVP